MGINYFKKTKIKILFFELALVLFGLILIGSTGSATLWFGDVNVIDEGQFGAWVNHMLNGSKMYKDIYITYGPFYVYPLYLLAKVFGPSASLIRFYILAGGFTGILSGLLIMYKLQFPFILRIAILSLFLLIPVFQLRQAFALMAVYCIMQAYDTKNSFWYLLGGGMAILGVLVSIEVGFIAFIIIGAYIFFRLCFERKIRVVFFDIVWLLSGAFIVFLPFLMWTTAEQWFADYIKTTSDVLTLFSGMDLPNGMGFPNALLLTPKTFDPIVFGKFIFSREILLYWGILFYIISFLYIIIVFLSQKISRKDNIFLFVILQGFFMYMIVIGRWGIGHFFFVLGPVIISMGYFILILNKSRHGEDQGSKAVSLALIAIILFFWFRLLFLNHPNIQIALFGIKYAFIPKENADKVGSIKISEKQKKYFSSISDFIVRNTRKTDTIFFVSNEPIMYMLTDRKNPTRYDLPYIAHTMPKRLEILHDLEKRSPKYIFINRNEWPVDGVSNSKRLPEVIAFISREYTVVGLIGDTTVYGIKDEKN